MLRIEARGKLSYDRCQNTENPVARLAALTTGDYKLENELTIQQDIHQIRRVQ